MKRTHAFVLLICMLASFTFSAASCGKETTDTNTTTTENAETQNDSNTSEEAKILPNLGDADFEGYTFNVLTRTSTSGDWVDWIPRDVFAEEENGEVLNDAVYKRNTYLEDKYNFKIEQKFTENFSADIKKAVNTGENLYDVVYPGLGDTPALAQAGYFYDLNELPNMDLSQPWWDQRAVSSLSVGNKLYFTSGDIMIINNDACPGIVFNKKLLQDHSLEDPYELVRSNQWTITKLYDMCKDIATDLNGDGQITYDQDRYGFIGQRDTTTAILHGAGELIASKDADDYPIVTFGSERSYRALDEYFKIIYDQSIAHNAHHLEGKVPAIYPVSEEMFMGNRALFMWVRLRIVENLRSMETDFGILPMPKLEADQKTWGHTVNKYTGCAMAVPTTADPERTGFILEAMAAESKYTTMPAYYETALKTKFSRDDDSGEMLDIIFSSTVFDIGEIYNFGSFGGDLIYMANTNDAAVASKFERASSKMEKDIQNCINKYDKLDH